MQIDRTDSLAQSPFKFPEPMSAFLETLGLSLFLQSQLLFDSSLSDLTTKGIFITIFQVFHYTDCISAGGIRLPKWVSWIWLLYNLMVKFEIWGMVNIPLLTSLPGPLWSGVVALDRVLSMGQIELNCVLMLNWIAWNRTFWHLNCALMLNWSVWNLIQL